MQLNRREAPLELEIQSLLILHGSAAAAASSLLEKYALQKLALPQLELISTFCLHAGLPASLIEFLGKQIQLDAQIPWGHFAEAMALAQGTIDPKLSKIIVEGAETQLLTWHLSRSHALDNFSTDIVKERELRRRANQEKASLAKRDLLIQVDMFRSQDLENEEGQALEKLLRMFPSDPQIMDQFTEYRARKALRLLEAKSAKPFEPNFEEMQAKLEPEVRGTLETIRDAMKDVWTQAEQDPQMGVDFAVAHAMWEHPEGSLEFLPEHSTSSSAMWLRAEMLAKTGRAVDLLAELLEIEKESIYDPEATFAVSYLRAQALWALGRKFEAIEILEGILNVKPQYRSAHALLAVWKRRIR